MVDGAFDEGNDGWNALGGDAAPQMMAQQQNVQEDVFAEAAFPASQAQVTIQTASGAAQNLDDDLTEEEKQICAEAAKYQEQLREDIHNKMMEEAKLKQERKSVGLAAINQWQQEREAQIQLRKQNNQQHESQFQTVREEERGGKNPWERIANNCDLTMQGVSAGGKDKTRMKEAIINRRADNAAGAGQVAPIFGSGDIGL